MIDGENTTSGATPLVVRHVEPLLLVGEVAGVPGLELATIADK